MKALIFAAMLVGAPPLPSAAKNLRKQKEGLWTDSFLQMNGTRCSPEATR